jgi:PAS domain S-box-containing protein
MTIDTVRRRYELILNGITDGVLVLDLSRNVVFENRAGTAMLGWQPAELIGRSPHSVIHHSRADGSTRPEGECAIYRTLADGTVRFEQDDVFWRKDGTAIRVEYTTAPIFDEEGSIAGAVLTFRDISRQKQMEQQIEQGLRVASLGRVSASVAHEFNNLLMWMLPFAQILQRKGELDPALAKPVKHVIDAVRRGQRLTDEILRYTNPPESHIARLDLGTITGDFCEEVHGILTGRRVEIEMPAALYVRADADQLRQVMLNLVTNARNATQTGGTVTIGAAPASSNPFVRKQIPEAEHFATLYVRDDGCGISAEAKEHIFEPFFTTRQHGTGLGLAVAYRIIAQHGGHLLLDSQVGRGSTFYVVLPRSK